MNGYVGLPPVGRRTNSAAGVMGAYGQPMPPAALPVGGIVAKRSPQNPYTTARGYRKPNQQELILEISILEGLTGAANVSRIENAPEFTRHCCVVKPYFHVLFRKGYNVTMPDGLEKVIEYYVHKECGRVIVVASTL